MKAFTVYQPYAFAIVAGLKHYETRPRRTSVRGRVAVHAGKKDAWRTGILESGNMPKIEKALAEFQGTGTRAARLEYGAVIGTVEIVDCVPVEEIAESLTERERALGDYSPGRFAWVLENPVIFDESFPESGKQGWWEWDQRTAEISRTIEREITEAAGRMIYSAHTGKGISEINSAVAEIVKRYCDQEEIVHGPTMDDISLGGAPIEVLPFLPFAIQTIDEHGTYSVCRWPKLIGTVTYNGIPVKETPGTAAVGIRTCFTPAEKMESVSVHLDFQKDGENI